MTALLFLTVGVLLVIGVPIAVCLGLAAMLVFVIDGVPLAVMSQSMFAGIDSFPLMAIPFFILAGNIMSSGGISQRLVSFANIFVAHIIGGLALVTIFAATFFAAISGSSPATVAAIGGVMIPEMKKKNYDESFTAATVAAAGIVGQVIPPSIPMVVYAVLAGISVTDIFIAGIIPGLVMSLAMALVAILHAYRNDIKPEGVRVKLREAITITIDSLWAILMPVIILGGIYSGIFTPTEAAAVAVVYGLLVGLFVYRELSFRQIPEVLTRSAIGTAIILLILATASSFGWVLTSERIPQAIANAMLSLTENRYVLLLMFNFILLGVGTFLNPSAAIVLLTPILLPVLTSVGVDPVLVGIIMIVNLAIGQITPPVGADLYVASNIAGIKIERLIVAIVPYLLVLIAALMIITYVPLLSLVFIR